MAYGDPIAVMSAYGDTFLDLTHANIIYRLAQQQQIQPTEFWKWLRDLNIELAIYGMYGEAGDRQHNDEQEFARIVAQNEWLDPESPDEPLRILREGHAGEQDFLTECYCDKCLIPLVKLCQDYP